MSHDARHVHVEIFGLTYNLRADSDPAYLETLAAYVDRKMQEVARSTKNVDTLKVAILAALNIADEHHRAQRAAAAHPAGSAGASSAGRSRGAASGAGAPSASRAAADLDRKTGDLIRILDEAIAE